VVKSARSNRMTLAVPMARRSPVGDRLRAILSPRVTRRKVSRGKAAASVVLGCGVLVAVSSAGPRVAEPPASLVMNAHGPMVSVASSAVPVDDRAPEADPVSFPIEPEVSVTDSDGPIAHPRRVASARNIAHRQTKDAQADCSTSESTRTDRQEQCSESENEKLVQETVEQSRTTKEMNREVRLATEVGAKEAGQEMRRAEVEIAKAVKQSAAAMREVNIPSIQTDTPDINISVPEIRVDTGNVHVHVPAIHCQIPGVHIHIPAIKVKVPESVGSDDSNE
jgi:hypothetical protein